MKSLSAALLALSCATAFAQYPGSQPVPGYLKKGFQSITIELAKKHLGYLAGPETEGRGTGQPGYQKAADYVAAEFKAAGLKPVGDNGTYFQGVPFTRIGLDPANSYITTSDGATKIIGLDNVTFGRLSADVDKSGPVVIVRANGEKAKLADDAALSGAVALVVGTPSRELRSQLRISTAVAVIFVNEKLSAPQPSIRRGRGNGSTSLGSVEITPSAARRLLTSLGEDPSLLTLSGVGMDEAVATKSSSQLRVVGKGLKEDIMVPNVVGLLEGSDPKLKTEIVGIGAHLDHLGKVGDVVYPGADDDGSGSTAVTLIAHAYKAAGIKPKRSILFMAFCGEEMGLIGSGHYSDNPIFPHENMIAELQMDMVGRDSEGVQNGDRNRVDVKAENIDTMRLVGSKRISTDLHNLIISMNKYVSFKFKYDAEDVYTRSDHYNFAKVGIPIAFLFDGFHPDYHQPTDTVDKINFEKLTNAAKLYFIVSYELANGKDRPRKDVSGN